MNKGKAQPAQDPRLAKWRDEGTILTVFLTNGTRLEGKIIAFDPQTIMVDSGEHNLVYKTMILTISPPRKGVRTGRRPPPRAGGRFEGQPRDGRPQRDDAGDVAGGEVGGAPRPPFRERTEGGPPREPRVPVVRYKRRLPDR
ncbi:MAG: RNA chaperone Hfq [Burkholderiales bacterium]